MEIIRSGDPIAITVTRHWARDVGAVNLLHHITGDINSNTSMTFGANLISVTNSEGLWVESSSGSENPAKILIPWSHVLTVRSNASFGDSEQSVGFIR
jgi:hypothetical protein